MSRVLRRVGFDDSTMTRPVDDRRAGAGTLRFAALALGATGVVFGDIGTSPLYTFNSVFTDLSDGNPTEEDLRGAFAVMFWTITWITCIKYVVVVMRITHHGEGGTLAMMQVILQKMQIRDRQDSRSLLGENQREEDLEEAKRTDADHPAYMRRLLYIGILSCSFLIGDGMITPPNSVLGAMNSPVITVPASINCLLSVLILILIFVLQRKGSGVIGVLSGPIMVVWLLSIGSLGIYQIVNNPARASYALGAFNPLEVYRFFVTGRYRGWNAFKSLAGTVLCVTGAEALYADVGHFGVGPISFAWFFLTYPCLILQYMGQAIALMEHPNEITGNPLYLTSPKFLLWPLSILATLAAIVASQAMISGVFSLLSQAHAMGFLPRILVLHTNEHEKGQVYIPEVNWIMMTMCILITVAFQTSDNLVAAYGISVTGAFLITAMMLWSVFRTVWGWSFLLSALVITPILFVDVAFAVSNFMKIFGSGWVPIAIAIVTFFLMQTHYWGRREEFKEDQSDVNASASVNADAENSMHLSMVPDLKTIKSPAALKVALQIGQLPRTDSTVVFITPKEGDVPRSVGALASSFGSVPKTVVLLYVSFEETPFVDDSQRIALTEVDLRSGIYCISVSFGYAEPLTTSKFCLPRVLGKLPREVVEKYPALTALAIHAPIEPMSSPLPEEAIVSAAEMESNLSVQPLAPLQNPITYVVSKRNFVVRPDRGCWNRLRVKLYAFLVRNGRSAHTFYGLEHVELLNKIHTLEVASTRFL